MFRLLGLLGGLSAATDLGTGSATDESLTRCVVASRLARTLGCDDDEVRTVVYVALLQHLGCTAFAHEGAAIWGDDIATTRLAFLTNWEEPRDLFRTWVPGVAAATDRSKAWVLATTLVSGRKVASAGPPATCEVAQDAARRLGLPEPVRESLGSILAMWNGKGYPKLSGHDIPRAARIMHVASTAVMFSLYADPGTALEQLRRRAETSLDPDIVAAFEPALLDVIGHEDAYSSALDAEPDPVLLVDEQELEAVARTVGDLVDLKSPWLTGHSSSVGDLAAEAARVLRLDDAAPVRLAGYLHDVGRVAVSSRIWDKPGRLSTGERDQVELHAHHSERILMRVPALARVARIAGQHHERCDGSGYHRGLSAGAMTMSARVLAAADEYHSLIEARPYRPASTPEEAAKTLRSQVSAGSLDGDAAAAVLTAAGHRSGVRRPMPAGLTERQVQVLRLVAAGLANPEIGRRLSISARTAERHVQDVYLKTGVRTRAGAALFAMEHGLVEKDA